MVFHLEEYIDNYMLGKGAQKVQALPSDDVESQQTFEDEDETSKKEFEDFKNWLDSSDQSSKNSSTPTPAAATAMPPPAVPAKKIGCVCSSTPCISVSSYMCMCLMLIVYCKYKLVK